MIGLLSECLLSRLVSIANGILNHSWKGIVSMKIPT
jgi:hypothetical protein